jgi:hypothetical protein
MLQARGKGDEEIHKRSGIAGLDEDLGEDDHLVSATGLLYALKVLCVEHC